MEAGAGFRHDGCCIAIIFAIAYMPVRAPLAANAIFNGLTGGRMTPAELQCARLISRGRTVDDFEHVGYHARTISGIAW